SIQIIVYIGEATLAMKARLTLPQIMSIEDVIKFSRALSLVL
ncbi:18193_t:CDS:1, partial [Gigaspora rosea]